MTMRYGTDDVAAGRRRRRAGQVPARQVEGSYRVDPRGNVTPPKELAPQQPRAAARQAVNQRNEPQYWVRGSASPREVGRIGGKVPPTRPQLSQAVDRFTDRYGAMQMPQATPMPFSQQLVQSGMMNTQPIWDTSSGQGVNAPGYSVNPFHPMWNNPNRFGNPWSHSSNRQMPGNYQFPDSTGGQSLNPMNYYWDNPEMPRTPRVWTGNEMTPQGFRGIMNTYGANVPWMRQNQMNPFGF